MKNNLKILLFIAIFALLIVGCGKKDNSSMPENTQNEQTEASSNEDENIEKAEYSYNIAALKGPTAIGLVNMMETEQNNNYEILATPDEVVSKILNKEIDIAAVPSNLASVLYNKTEGDISVLAINTLGVLYIVENGDTIKSIEDLKGKTIYATGKGATPEYTLNYILEKAGILNDVNIEFKTEHSELATLLAEGKADIALLPQPFVTSAMEKNPNLKIALNLTEEWEKLDENSTMITGVLIARNSIIEENKDNINDFLGRYRISIIDANAEVEKTAELVEKYNILPKEIAKKAIPNCNMAYVDGEDMQNLLSSYLSILNSQDAKSIGGKLPDEKFYYKQ